MKKLLQHEKVRFVIAGVGNTLLDFLILNILVFIFGFYALVGNILSVTIGITVSYFLNHYFVFQSKKQINLRAYLLFFCVTGFSSLVIQSLIIFGFEVLFRSSFGHSLFMIGSLYDHAALQLNIAKATAVLLGMVWNFTLYKHVIFRKKADEITALDIEAEL